MKAIWIIVLLAAGVLSACESGLPPASHWRADCIKAGHAGGTPELDACVAKKQADYEAECLSAAAACE